MGMGGMAGVPFGSAPIGGVPLGGAPLGGPIGGLPLGGAPLGTPAPAPVGQVGGIPPFPAFQNSDITVTFTFQKPNPASPHLTHITLNATNLTGATLDNFVFQGTTASSTHPHSF
jgi:hypothetical protein